MAELVQKLKECVQANVTQLLLPVNKQQHAVASLWAEVVVTCCIATIGVLGNAASYAVLRRSDSESNSSALPRTFTPTGSLLRTLAAYDVAFLAITVARNVAHHYYMYAPDDGAAYGQPYDEALAKVLAAATVYLVALQSAALYASAIVMALVTLERYRAVCKPFTAAPSEHRTRATAGAAAAFALLFYAPKAFEYESAHYCGIGLDGNNRLSRVVSLYGLRSTDRVAGNVYYRVIYTGILEVLLRDLVTMTFVIVTNTRLVHRMLRLRRRLSSLPAAQRWSSAGSRPPQPGELTGTAAACEKPQPLRSNLHRSTTDGEELTRTVTIVVATAVTFTVPATFVRLTNLVVSFVPPPDVPAGLSTQEWSVYAPIVSNLFLTVGASVNFFVYVLCARKFRTIFLKCLADCTRVNYFKQLSGLVTARWRHVTPAPNRLGKPAAVASTEKAETPESGSTLTDSCYPETSGSTVKPAADDGMASSHL